MSEKHILKERFNKYKCNATKVKVNPVFFICLECKLNTKSIVKKRDYITRVYKTNKQANKRKNIFMHAIVSSNFY